MSDQSFKSDCDKIIKELHDKKKDLNIIVEENLKLQSDLKIKNETIGSLINQNFVELKTLQEKHDTIVNALIESYGNNIKNMDSKNKLFCKSVRTKLVENIDTHYKLSNEKNSLLTEQNKVINFRNSEMSKQLEISEEMITNLSSKYHDVLSKYNKIETESSSELIVAKQTVSLHNETIIKLSSELSDIRSRCNTLFNDNISKQTLIDEKTLESLTLSAKVTELEKKYILSESNKSDNNVKIAELTDKVNSLKSEMVSLQKNHQQLLAEKNVAVEEKNHYFGEMEHYRNKFKNLERTITKQIRDSQDILEKEKKQYLEDQNFKMDNVKNKCEQKIEALHIEYETQLSDKEKQLGGVLGHLKSFSDNQHIVLEELEKIKHINEKLKTDKSHIDKKFSDLNAQHKMEMDNLKTAHKKEKDIIMESYNETIGKSQELNDALQTRLNQSIEALGLSKVAIANLRGTNQNLEKQIAMNSGEDTHLDKYNQIKSENSSLREKLEKSIELNNSFVSKEKHHDTQIKQLQTKYNQIVSLAKKGIVNHNINF